ncbi:hsp90-like protein [Colletotrichum karsti]|uniref:Hsp90-like protein n=1 Tax=Colletotrichum karsti TaxID=1095194 RepID=A0A9P6I7M2_9PEZI|nr:hsp90-like protein [Colletotrichum karsti]KAF9875466.1 hsp90-like protein [Colletotrichum karsti]
MAASRLGVSRALISLFDTKYQYIVAEATPTLPLVPNAAFTDSEHGENLWLCGTALPRAQGLCESVLVALRPDGTPIKVDSSLPVSVIADMETDTRSSGKVHYKNWPHPRFYAGVPIKSRRGVSIGVFSVWSDEPRQEFDATSQELLRGLSRTITDHLDSRRIGERHNRAVRMLRGMGSFVEGKSTMFRLGTQTKSFANDTSAEGALNQNQQQLQDKQEARESQDRTSDSPASSPGASPRPSPIPRPSPTPSQQTSASDVSVKSIASGRVVAKTNEETHLHGVRHIFSKASNIIRESIQVEGALFLDASIGSFAGLATNAASSGSFSSSSSSDERGTGNSPRNSTSGEPEVPCRILGHSNSISSSIDQQSASRDHPLFSERFLAKLLHRYPEGRILNFDENGSLQSSDFSEEETKKQTSTPAEAAVSVQATTERARKRRKRLHSRRNEGKILMSLFSGARSVALVPLWDAHKQRWFSGGFVYTKTPTRVLTIEGELSYLRAFGTVIMSEVARYNALMVDKAKSDLLSSISHELRSPLHGILLGAELMQDTALDAFQGDVLHSVETCGRTLLDTLDHLLDYSKLGNFLRPTSGRRSSATGVEDRGLRSNDKQLTIEAGMISLTKNCNIDVLAEEVIESMCVGFSFQRFAVSRLAGNRPSEHADTNILSRLDGMQALENMASKDDKTGDAHLLLGDVSVTYDVNPASSWRFHTQPGALRRILLNILGNSLKYTSKGYVNVSVKQVDSDQPRCREVHITVADTGKGMTEDYVRYHFAAPFYQEDNLSAGTGLGLSLVKEVVTRLGGSIEVQSKLGRGTRVTVKLPLAEAEPPSPKTSIPKAINFDDFRAQVSELKGLRVRLLGFQADTGYGANDELSAGILSEGTLIENMCRDWLQMHIINDSSQQKLIPDLVLATERNLDRLLFERRQGVVSTPVVFVCRNALIARQLATSPRFTGRRVVFEFVSQPIGPRKLARILLLSFRRWTKMQASVIPTPTALSLASIEYSQLANADTSPPDPRTTSARSNETFVDRTEYFDAVDTPTEGTDGEIQEDEGASASTKTLVDRSVNRSSTPTPREPEPVKSPEEDNSDLFLLVDDNPLNVRILESYMKKLGHKYTTATDGKQAVDAFKSSAGRYKCIFMDISMPVMDGFEATREIRVFETKENLPRCQVFALTGLASASAQEEAFASGIDLFLTKPVKLKELSKILETRDLA